MRTRSSRRRRRRRRRETYLGDQRHSTSQAVEANLGGVGAVEVERTGPRLKLSQAKECLDQSRLAASGPSDDANL